MAVVVPYRDYPHRYPTFGKQRVWAFAEEDNLVYLLSKKLRYYRFVRTRDLCSSIVEIYPRIVDYGHIRRSLVEVVYKIHDLIYRFQQFEWLINAPGVKYDENTNTITAGQDYFMLVRGKEELGILKFMRKHPLKKYRQLKTLFVEKEVENVDFPWLLRTLSSPPLF